MHKEKNKRFWLAAVISAAILATGVASAMAKDEERAAKPDFIQEISLPGFSGRAAQKLETSQSEASKACQAEAEDRILVKFKGDKQFKLIKADKGQGKSKLQEYKNRADVE